MTLFHFQSPLNRLFPMDLGLLPPSSPNPNPIPNSPIIPSDKPPDPKITPPPFESIPKNSLDNPFKGPDPVDQVETHQRSLEEAEKMVKAPFKF